MKPITNIREFIESVTVRGSEHYITRENVDRIVDYLLAVQLLYETTAKKILEEFESTKRLHLEMLDNTKNVIKD